MEVQERRRVKILLEYSMHSDGIFKGERGHCFMGGFCNFGKYFGNDGPVKEAPLTLMIVLKNAKEGRRRTRERERESEKNRSERERI